MAKKYQNSSDLNAALHQAVERRKEQEKNAVDPKQRWKQDLATARTRKTKALAILLLPLLCCSLIYAAWALGFRFGPPGALTAALADPDNVSELRLEGAKLGRYPEEISSLPRLKRLHLDSNEIAQLPLSVGQLQGLRTLSLRYNKLSSLPKELAHLEGLEVLDLKGNSLTSLPEELSNLKSLKVLDLTNNRLQELPKDIGQMSSLEELRLRGNRISQLPGSLAKLHKLRVLELTGNPISELPPPSNFPALTRLSVGGTKISPPTVEAYQKLPKVSVMR
jgi:Leucine-rich repeat (LRR) protein